MCSAEAAEPTPLKVTMVVAHYKESLTWLADVPLWVDIVVYNKELVSPTVYPKDRLVRFKNVPNVGRESDSYARFVLDFYDDMPDRVFFTQADPFPHCPRFWDLLRDPRTWEVPFHPFSLHYAHDRVPPAQVLDSTGHAETRARLERMSCFTLNSIYFHDPGSLGFYTEYLKAHKLPVGTNVMAHHFQAIGLPDLLPPGTELLNFSYGAIFATTKERIRAHPREVYEAIQARAQGNWSNGYVIERSWTALFAPELALPPPVRFE